MVKCPYCNKSQKINHDDGYGYEEDRIHQQECDSCDKTFIYTTSIVFYYDVDVSSLSDSQLKDMSHVPVGQDIVQGVF